ncbi:hypothetical protein [Gudongella sp. SC589]|uniref:hypothetical protein n=1 Tax=Gudongella sp. SC589 TaxID=3385990 RepID=UPI0039048346
MKVLNRGLAIVLAGVLILGGGAAFAVSPNANPNALNNPARIKAMEKTGNVMEVMSGIVDDVDIKIIPMENGNVGLIEGEIDLKTGQNFENFKGNTKLKVKLNNVTVNINEYGEFSQPMPMWKIEPLSVRVFMGKVLVYSNVEDDLDEIRDDKVLEKALAQAERYFTRLYRSLEDLDIEDIGLVKSARHYYDILDERIGSDDDYNTLMARYYKILRDAEDEIQDLLEDMIYWDDDLDYDTIDESYKGELWIHDDLEEEILVIVDYVDSKIDDEKIKIEEDGKVKFEAEDDEFQVRVEYDGVEIIKLRETFN